MPRLKLDGSLRIQKQARPAHGRLHLAKPRLRSVINSLTFIVTRTIRHKGKDGKLAFLPLPLLRPTWRSLSHLPILKQQSIYIEINLKRSYAISTERME